MLYTAGEPGSRGHAEPATRRSGSRPCAPKRWPRSAPRHRRPTTNCAAAPAPPGRARGRTGGGSDRGAARGRGEAGAGVPDELGCALTLTRRSAENLADRALRLADLPGTAGALALGWIDMPKALTVIDGVAALDPGAARAVEDHVLAKAPRQTTGELRAAVRRAGFPTDPTAARPRREEAEKDPRS